MNRSENGRFNEPTQQEAGQLLRLRFSPHLVNFGRMLENASALTDPELPLLLPQGHRRLVFRHVNERFTEVAREATGTGAMIPDCEFVIDQKPSFRDALHQIEARRPGSDFSQSESARRLARA